MNRYHTPNFIRLSARAPSYAVDDREHRLNITRDESFAVFAARSEFAVTVQRDARTHLRRIGRIRRGAGCRTRS
jgi:hypothetical protein